MKPTLKVNINKVFIASLVMAFGISAIAKDPEFSKKTKHLAKKQARLEKKLIQQADHQLDASASKSLKARAAMARGSFETLSKLSTVKASQVDVEILLHLNMLQIANEVPTAKDRKEALVKGLKNRFQELAKDSENSTDLVFEPYRDSQVLSWTASRTASVYVAAGSGDVTVQVSCLENCTAEMKDQITGQTLDVEKAGPSFGSSVVLKTLVIGLTPISVEVRSTKPTASLSVHKANVEIYYSRPTAGNSYQPKCYEDGQVCAKLEKQIAELGRLENNLESDLKKMNSNRATHIEFAETVVRLIGNQVRIAKRAEQLIRSGYVNPSEKSEIDSMNDLGQNQSLRLQRHMDRLTKAETALSNLAKKFSETTAGIVQNLK